MTHKTLYARSGKCRNAKFGRFGPLGIVKASACGCILGEFTAKEYQRHRSSNKRDTSHGAEQLLFDRGVIEELEMSGKPIYHPRILWGSPVRDCQTPAGANHRSRAWEFVH